MTVYVVIWPYKLVHTSTRSFMSLLDSFVFSSNDSHTEEEGLLVTTEDDLIVRCEMNASFFFRESFDRKWVPQIFLDFVTFNTCGDKFTRPNKFGYSVLLMAKF